MMEFYQQRFANAADFTFFFVGAFKVDEMMPLLDRLHRLAAVEGHADVEARRSADAVPDLRGARNGAPRAASRAARRRLRSLPIPGSKSSRTTGSQAAASVLQDKLRDILREQLGGTYSVGAGYSSTSPEPGYGDGVGAVRQLAGERREAHGRGDDRDRDGCAERDRRPPT